MDKAKTSAEAPDAAQRQHSTGATSAGSSLALLHNRPEVLHPRDRWSSVAEFLLSVMGYAIGLGNMWRFPYLCYENGGGAFLVPYIFATICTGIPYFFMELAIGQFLQVGVLGIWKVCPLFKGVGIASVIITFWIDMYYIVIMAWALLFLALSLNTTLPWAECGHDWNTENCRTETELLECRLNASLPNCLPANVSQSSAKEFWERRILSISSGADEPGNLRWELLLCLIAMWIFCYFCLWKGPKWTGKVVWVTALAPYVLLTILLLRSIFLPGAFNGLKFYFIPDFKRLAEPKVWFAAATQVMYSYGIGFGSLVALGSYNRYHNNIYRLSIIASTMDFLTSIYIGIVVFSVIGFMAEKHGRPIESVVDQGPGLVFLVYPTAILEMPISPLWSVIFFLTVLSIGIDSEFCMLEGFITACFDEWRDLLKDRKEVFVLFVCFVKFVIGISCITEGGVYIFNIFDTFSASGFCVFMTAVFQGTGITYFYGANRFYDDITDMIGYRPNCWWKFCWRFISPVVLIVIFFAAIIDYSRFKYQNYVYPVGYEVLGWMISCTSIIWIPLYAIYLLLRLPGTPKERVVASVQPQFSLEQLRSLKRPKSDLEMQEEEKAKQEKTRKQLQNIAMQSSAPAVLEQETPRKA